MLPAGVNSPWLAALLAKVVTVVDNECEWDESTNFFEFLQLYACLFESLEASKLTKEMVFSIEDVIFAPKIASVVMNATTVAGVEPTPPGRVVLQHSTSLGSFEVSAENLFPLIKYYCFADEVVRF